MHIIIDHINNSKCPYCAPSYFLLVVKWRHSALVIVLSLTDMVFICALGQLRNSPSYFVQMCTIRPIRFQQIIWCARLNSTSFFSRQLAPRFAIMPLATSHRPLDNQNGQQKVTDRPVHRRCGCETISVRATCARPCTIIFPSISFAKAQVKLERPARQRTSQSKANKTRRSDMIHNRRTCECGTHPSLGP